MTFRFTYRTLQGHGAVGEQNHSGTNIVGSGKLVRLVIFNCGWHYQTLVRSPLPSIKIFYCYHPNFYWLIDESVPSKMGKKCPPFETIKVGHSYLMWLTLDQIILIFNQFAVAKTFTTSDRSCFAYLFCLCVLGLLSFCANDVQGLWVGLDKPIERFQPSQTFS